MGLSSPWATDQHNILRTLHELAAVQLTHSRFIDLAGGEVEPREVLVGGEARRLHVIGNGTDLALGQLRFQQLSQDRHTIVGKPIPGIVF